MTSLQRELSVDRGAPIEVYDFRRGTRHYCYTSAQRDQAYLGRQYVATPGLARSAINDTGEPDQEALTITAPADIEVAELFKGMPTSETVALTIYELHVGEADGFAIWSGTLENVKRPTGSSVLVCEPLLSKIYSRGLRLAWQRPCPHCIYDLECRVPKADFRVAVSLSDVNPIALKGAAFSAQPDGWFRGGFIEWTADGGRERRSISEHTGDNVFLLGTSYGLAAGMDVDAYPGCDQTTGEGGCSKFDNLPNFGGVPGLPDRSPMDGTTLF